MAEIAALTVARAAALATDAVRLREQQEEARARRDLERQQQLEAQNRAIAAERAADQRRLEVLRDERRVEQENRLFFETGEELRRLDLADQQFVFLQGQIEGEILDARDFRAAEDARDLNAPAAPAGPELAPSAAPAVEVPDALDPARDLNFQALEDARDARLAERRDAERDAAIQQRIDLQQAEDRIAGTPPTPGLPRGSIVDVTG